MLRFIHFNNGHAKIAPCQISNYLALVFPFLPDIVAAVVKFKGFGLRTHSVNAEKSIIGSTCTCGPPSANKKLVKIGPRGTCIPGSTRSFRPTRDRASTTDDRMLSGFGLPDGVAVFWSKEKRFEEIVRPGTHGNRDRSYSTGTALCASNIASVGQSFDGTFGRNNDLLGRNCDSSQRKQNGWQQHHTEHLFSTFMS